MKTLVKTIMVGLAFSMIACSSDDSKPVKEPSAKFVVEDLTAANIPDGSSAAPGILEKTISVTTEGIIADASKISVKLDLQHVWIGDLVVQVFNPSGESCTLIKRLGNSTFGSNRDFLLGNVIAFNSAASMSINDAALNGNATNIPAGTYLPGKGTAVIPEAVVMTDLATFLNGKSIKGDWKIKIGDYTVGDTGVLHNWKIEFETGALE